MGEIRWREMLPAESQPPGSPAVREGPPAQRSPRSRRGPSEGDLPRRLRSECCAGADEVAANICQSSPQYSPELAADVKVRICGIQAALPQIILRRRALGLARMASDHESDPWRRRVMDCAKRMGVPPISHPSIRRILDNKIRAGLKCCVRMSRFQRTFVKVTQTSNQRVAGRAARLSSQGAYPSTLCLGAGAPKGVASRLRIRCIRRCNHAHVRGPR